MSLTSAVRSLLKASTTSAGRFSGFICEEVILIVSLKMREVGHYAGATGRDWWENARDSVVDTQLYDG